MLARGLHTLRRQLHSTRRHAVVAAASAAGADSVAGPRRRRKLFKTEDHSGPSQQLQQQEQAQEDPAGRRRRSRRLATQQQQQQHQEQQQQQQTPAPPQEQQEQQQQRWWQHPAAQAEMRLHVYWDLDNLHPAHWEQAADLVDALKGALRPFGRLREMQAYANTNTLVSTVGVDGIDQLVDEGDELRCSICGRRCKSFDDLQKHFKQLHEREHQKKLRGPKKAAAKYAKSDKASRVRDAGRLFGTPKKNRSGRKGQMVKLVLQRAGLKVIEVASGKSQAADDAINQHVDKLLEQLKAAEPEPSTSAAVMAEAGMPPWGSDSALQQAVLVLVSDDRGFAATAAKWLQRGGAGVVLVTARGRAGWQEPLARQLNSRTSSSRLPDAICVSWEDLVSELAKSYGWDEDTLYEESEEVFGSNWGGTFRTSLLSSTKIRLFGVQFPKAPGTTCSEEPRQCC